LSQSLTLYIAPALYLQLHRIQRKPRREAQGVPSSLGQPVVDSVI
jgi:hypothetical protein